jgi:eukaryotic-like serine/threonine-protein kinase
MIHRDLVPGKLHVVRRIGAGGMGVVYEAIHLGLGRRVAVKVIHPQSSESVEARIRFLREARALALLQSEHIVQVLDVDTLPEGDPYMVMEYLEGRDLKRELMKRGPLPVAEAVGYLIQAASGVAAAHGAGIIHRDIKPANIFISHLEGARRVKLLDFGVAKFAASADKSLTGPANLLGTPLYMSPEQITGVVEADTGSDLWALGVVLFQVLTGHSPFRPTGGGGVVGAILSGATASLHETRDDVPPALSAVVARCFATNPADRLTDARELVAALTPFGAREATVSVSQRAPRGSSAPPPAALSGLLLVQRSGGPSSPASLLLREATTVTHLDRVKLATTRPPAAADIGGAARRGEDELGRDPDGSVRIPSSSASPTQTASAPTPSVSEVSEATNARAPTVALWRKLLPPLAGAIFVGLGLAISWSLFANIAAAPDPAGARGRTSAAPAARLPAPEGASRIASADGPIARPGTVPQPSSSTARRSPAAAPSAKARPLPKRRVPSAPTGSAAVPLHL